MKRKLITVVLCLVTVCALFTSAGAQEAEETKAFSLQQAVDYALENSNAIKLSKSEASKARVSLREAESAVKQAEDVYDMTGGHSFDMLKVEQGYYKVLAEAGVVLAEKGMEQAVETVTMAVQSAYFDLLFARDKVKLQKSILDSARKDMDIANKKYELGMVSKMDVLSYEAALESAKLTYWSAQRDAEYKLMSFNKTLGLPLKTMISLTDNLGHTAPGETDIEAKVAEALENRIDILAARSQYDIDKKGFEIADIWYTSTTYAYRQAKHQMESSQYKLASTEQEVELSVRKAYMDMQSAYESIGVLAKNVERLEKAYDIARLRYDTGMATSQEVVNALNAFNDIKLQHLQAIHGYNLAKIQFEASSGVGIVAPGGF